MGNEKEVRVVVRVPEKLYLRLDDRRHSERTTFQAIGLELFGEYLEGQRPAGATMVGEFSLRRDEIILAEKLISILRAEPTQAAAALRQVINAFAGLLEERRITGGGSRPSTTSENQSGLERAMLNAEAGIEAARELGARARKLTERVRRSTKGVSKRRVSE